MLLLNKEESVLHAEAQSRQWAVLLHKLIPKFFCIMVNFYSFCISTPPRFAAAGLPAHTGFGIQQCPFLVEERSAKAFLGPPGCFRLARPAAPFRTSSALHHTGWQRPASDNNNKCHHKRGGSGGEDWFSLLFT